MMPLSVVSLYFLYVPLNYNFFSSLDPSDDPLDCMSMIDFYALRSDQYDYLLRLEEEALVSIILVLNFKI